MHVAGIDIGAGTAKIIVLRDEEIISSSIIPVEGNLVQTATEVTDRALKTAALSLGNIDYTVSTGYGRNIVPFSNDTASEIICHALGMHFLLPQVRTIIEIGAQDSKIIKINAEGRVINFVMNDKCAAGTGRFLEVIARVLGVDIQEMGRRSLNSKNPCTISSTCTVFTETEVISLRAQGMPVQNLIAGVHKAIASRVIMMGSSITLEKPIAFTGGVAKNAGVKKALEEASGFEILIPDEPQTTGALGAALCARAKFIAIK